MKGMNIKKRTGINGILRFLPVMIIMLTAAVICGVMAKYVMKRTSAENIVDTHNFYFASDTLEDTGNNASSTLIKGTDQITFELRNFEDELRYADMKVYYTVSVQTTAAAPAISPATGELAGGAKSSASVTLSGLTPNNDYTVIAEGYSKVGDKKSYIKTLKVTFHTPANVPHVYKSLATDTNNDYVELTVWTEESAKGDILITYPVGLIPDNTDPAMVSWTTASSATVTGTDTVSFAAQYSSHVYRFFKVNSADVFDADSFTVTVGGIEAVIPT